MHESLTFPYSLIRMRSMKLLKVYNYLIAMLIAFAAPASLAANLVGTAYAEAKCPEGSVRVSSALSMDKKLGNECIGNKDTNPIFALISQGIKYFTIVFGFILVLVIIIAGIQYITSAGSPDGTKEAKDRFQAAATGLILYMLMFAILQVILPADARVFR